MTPLLSAIYPTFPILQWFLMILRKSFSPSIGMPLWFSSTDFAFRVETPLLIGKKHCFTQPSAVPFSKKHDALPFDPVSCSFFLYILLFTIFVFTEFHLKWSKSFTFLFLQEISTPFACHGESVVNNKKRGPKSSKKSSWFVSHQRPAQGQNHVLCFVPISGAEPMQDSDTRSKKWNTAKIQK